MLWVPYSCTTREMVLTRPQHHNRRGVPGGITFGHNMGCQLACCNPGSRQELATRRIPLPYDCRIAFLMGCSRAVPRLAEDCAPSLRRMPLEVVRRIIELCTRCAHELSPQRTPGVLLAYPHLPRVRSVERRVITRAPLPLKVNDDLVDQTRGLSLDMPI